MNEGAARLASIYARFAEAETQGRSPLYTDLCRGIAGDEALLERLATLPLEKQQPNLLLAAVKYLFGEARDWPHFRSLVGAEWSAIVAVILARRTQTNEPARCALLLPLLALLPQPLALLEVGASAGLCLLPDHYAYDYDGRYVGPSVPVIRPPLFRCQAGSKTPIPARNVEVVWRTGLDLNPLDCGNDDDMRWLKALVWPGEGERARLLDEALEVARAHPPRVVKGDLRHDVPALAAAAPRDATLVVFHTAVLAYVPLAADRDAFAATVHSLNAEWISNESANLYDLPGALELGVWGRFLLLRNGQPVAHTEAHGTEIEWLA